MVKSDRRPGTATLIKPTVLDTKLLGILDMSTVSREHLIAIKNLVHSTPRCKCKQIGTKCKNFSFTCDSKSNEADASIQKMYKVLNKTYRIRSNAVRHRLLGDLLGAETAEKIPVVPAPCATCGRQDQPERFHSHPSRIEVKSKLNETKQSEQRKTVQKPVAIKFRSAKSKIRQSQDHSNKASESTTTNLPSPSNVKIGKEFGSPKRVSMTSKPTTNDEDKENDAAAGVSKVDRKVKLVASKWKDAIRKDARLKPELRESSQIRAVEILTKIRDKQQKHQQQPEYLLPPEADVSPFGGYKLDSWNPAPVSGGRKRKVVCYLCAQEFGTAALPSHEAQCIRKYLKGNERNSDPDTNDGDSKIERPLSQARDHWKLAWELTQEMSHWYHWKRNFTRYHVQHCMLMLAKHQHYASLVACELCDRKFLPTRLEAHRKSCLSQVNIKHGTKTNNKALIKIHSIPTASDVLCEHCGKWCRSSSISLHREQHTTNNEYKMTDPFESQSFFSHQRKLPVSSLPPSNSIVICHVCGQNFDNETITSHERQCTIEWKLQNDKFPPDSSKPWLSENSDTISADCIDEINQSQIDSPVSEELFWKAHQAQLVPCSKCGRTFFPQRLEVHLRGCKGPAKNKLK